MTTNNGDQMTPMHKLVMEQIAPLMEQAIGIAEQNGVPLFCVVQTTSLVPGEVGLASVSAHVRHFRHPAPMRFLIDFYHSAQGDPNDAGWQPGQRNLAEGFVQMGALWATTGNELLRRLAVASAFVIAQGFSQLPDHLIGRIRTALNVVVGPAAAEDFHAAVENLKVMFRAANSPFTVVDIPSGAPVPPGRH